MFEGPLSGFKDKQRAGLIVNWLGKEATQIFTSLEAELNNTDEVYTALEKVFRPESNHFKLRNMKQKASQTCKSYMFQLRLVLPECKYKYNSDEFLKDQFIFGIENKKIQDHLLGEISEGDNSVKSLYEARKIESKLAQRKLLRIVNPANLVSVDVVKHKGRKSQFFSDCKYCGKSQDKGECPAFGKKCNGCGG